MRQAVVRQADVAFMGKTASSVHIEGGRPFDEPRVVVVAGKNRVELYGDGTARLFHRRFLRGSADVVKIGSDARILGIELAEGVLKGYDVLATSADGSYKVKAEGTKGWMAPADSLIIPPDASGENRKVKTECAKAWQFYGDYATAVVALRADPGLRDKLAELPAPAPWNDVARGGGGTFVIKE